MSEILAENPGLRERHNLTSDLPREEDRIMSGYLGLVAIWVTQPLWPSSVPLNWRVSEDILADAHRKFGIFLPRSTAAYARTTPEKKEIER